MKKLLIFGILILFSSCSQFNLSREECALVMGKERITDTKKGNSTSYYLIFTDKGEFTIADELLRGNFESSRWYGKMQVGKNYSFATGGYRIPFLSQYKNIYSEPKICL
jgi:hypothetical protein